MGSGEVLKRGVPRDFYFCQLFFDAAFLNSAQVVFEHL